MKMIENEIAAKDQLTEQVQRFKDELNGKMMLCPNKAAD